MANWQRWIPGGLLAVGCLLIMGGTRQRHMELARPLSTLPRVLAGQSGRDLVISPEEQRVAGMSSYLLRSYPDSAGERFTVYVGYYDHQVQGQTIHSPKNCLPGAGWEALESRLLAVRTPAGVETVNRYLLVNGPSRALVLYWYQGRGRVAASEYRVKWELLRDAALSGRSEEALVRIVVYVDGVVMTDERAEALAGRVAAELIPAVREALPN